MTMMIGEFIEHDIDNTGFTFCNANYYYVYVDAENNFDEILLATHNTLTGETDWEDNEVAKEICHNRVCEYVKRNLYSYNGSVPVHKDILIYDILEEELGELDV